MTLEERVAEWPKRWLQKGVEQGMERGIEQGPCTLSGAREVAA